MEINIDENKKLAMIWLTSEESTFYRQVQNNFLQPLLDSFIYQRIKTAIFLSGSQSLPPLTQDLLRHNRNKLAEQAVPNKST